MTGEGATETTEAEPASPFAKLDRPVLVYITHPGAGGDEDQKLQDVVFKNEKVGLGAKAFRTVRIDPDNAEKDAVLAGEGSEVPRLLLVDPSKEKVTVLEKSKLKPGSLYSEMKKVAGRFYKENLDKVVKTHLKLLTERDQLYNEQKVLTDKESRLKDEDGSKAKKDLEKIREELADLQKEWDELAKQEVDLWKLTPKDGGEPEEEETAAA